MHELSIAGNILQMVERTALRERFDRVRALHLSVPVLAAVEVSALRFALQSIAPGSLLQGAEFTIDEPTASGYCARCDLQTEVTERWQSCRQCGQPGLTVTGETSLRVVDLLVA